jgi:alanyl-tRNA synthetase
MSSDEIRRKYFTFFEEKGHVRIEPTPLVLENDPTTLFTSAGMQPLIPYLKGEKHPKGKRLVDSQPSLRLQDIEEVGDNKHTTFFEMLGNWSLGDYFKREQLEWCLEFFTSKLGLPREKLWVSVFEGTKDVPRDEESFETWKSLGIPEDKIFFYGVDKNWWSRSGAPDKMPPGEIGGPDSEIFYDFGTPHDPKYGKDCHPNCECGRFLEIGNSVFVQYQKNEDGTLSELPQKNVDFGGGLERIAAAVNGNPDIFRTDLFKPIISNLEDVSGKSYKENQESMRIIADHIRAAVFLVAEGLLPSNKLQGYVSRRLIRRAVFRISKLGTIVLKELPKLTAPILEIYKNTYLSGVDNYRISSEIGSEADRFLSTLGKGIKYLEAQPSITTQIAFNSLATYGLPFEVTQEIASQRGDSLSREAFEKEFEKHRELSKTASAGMFKGGLADASEQVTKLHTATHLLHAALRKVLGEHVSQKGSNITAERLRFDFSHPEKLSDEEIKKVEDLINEQLNKDLPVSYETKTLDEAIKEGALHFFGERYGSEVKVYTIGDPKGEWFSKEVCGGPHVLHTAEIGSVRILKQEKVGSGVVRIYAATG